ncbi:cytochrome P450 [Azohydromonas australica]|uniref:cytochrome P450 n=1 Tax=Azohydromonas australica TaxID=364039 RepID=UPI001EE47A47|nr:cytochrome P450 [Azohydromonas australica]
MKPSTMRGAEDAASVPASASEAAVAAGALPPGPAYRWWGLPVLRAMARDFLGYAEARHRAHGDVCLMRIGSRWCYDLFTPDLVREALVDRAEDLVRRPRTIGVLKRCFGLGEGVITTEGATWQRQRRMLMPAFTPRQVAGHADQMRAAAGAALERAVPEGEAQALVDVEALFGHVAMDVILRTLFGRPADGEAEAAAGAMRVLGEAAMFELIFPFTVPAWLPRPGKAGQRRALHTLHALVDGHIARRRALPDPESGEDLLARLLALRDDATGEGLSEREVFDQCMVSFQAGHETTATALAWWSRLLAGHPAAAARARAEVDAVLGGRDPGPEDLPSLAWLTATLKEAMRLYPPLPAVITRHAVRDITVGGWRIPRGASVYVTPWVLHRDPRWWESPDEFRPERFLPGAPPVPRGAYMPFGVGPRVCIGQHFAMLEMTLVAAMLLQRHELALPADAPALEPVLHVTLRPKGGMRLGLRRRA